MEITKQISRALLVASRMTEVNVKSEIARRALNEIPHTYIWTELKNEEREVIYKTLDILEKLQYSTNNGAVEERIEKEVN